MNIAVMCNGLSEGITDRRELVQSLKTKGHNVFVCGRMGKFVNPFYSDNHINYLAIDASRNNTNPFKELLTIKNNIKILKSNNIDATIIYGVKNHPSMAIAAHIAKVKRIMCIVNGSGNLFRFTGIKGKILRFISFPMLRIAYSKCVAICFQNEDDLRLFKDKKLITKRTHYFITGGSGVNLNDYPYYCLPNENIFLFLSRITPSKGIHEYINAARLVKEKYPEAIFDIVGPIDGLVENSIDLELKEAVNDGIVKYHGATNDVPSWMKKCRFFIYPSYYPAGVPRCVLQAMSTGRPIITCDTPGCKETVKDGINGCVVSPRNVNLLAEKMLWFIEHPLEVENMAKNSRDYAEKKFDVFKINNEIMSKLLQLNE